MNRNRRLWTTATIGIAVLLLAACAPGPEGGSPVVWIDVPVDGLNVAEGAPVNIEGHASHISGIDHVEVWADGALATTLTEFESSGSLYAFQSAWTPASAGEHTLQVIAFTPDGAPSEPDSARIIVGLPEFAGPDLSIVSVEALVELYKDDIPICNTRVVYRNDGTEAIPGEFDIKFAFDGVDQHTTSVAGGLPAGAESEVIFVYQFDGLHYIGINLDWGEAIAETNEVNNAFAEARQCGGAVPPTATIVPPGEPIVSFYADPPEIAAGACTTLRWEVQNASQVIFGGIEQPMTGSYSACLCEDERYSLRVTDSGGVETRHTVDVAITGVCATPTIVDSTPPPAPSPAVPANGANLSCRGSQTLAWLPVNDESGIKEYQAQVQRHSGDNNWQDVSGSIFTVGDKQMNLNVECGWYYRFRVRAVDGVGNVGNWSGWSTFSITLG